MLFGQVCIIAVCCIWLQGPTIPVSHHFQLHWARGMGGLCVCRLALVRLCVPAAAAVPVVGVASVLGVQAVLAEDCH